MPSREAYSLMAHAQRIARRTVEDGERLLARHVYLASARPGYLSTDLCAKAPEQIAPPFGRLTGDSLRRVGDAREEDGREHPLRFRLVPDAGEKLFYLVDDRALVADEGQVIFPR